MGEGLQRHEWSERTRSKNSGEEMRTIEGEGLAGTRVFLALVARDELLEHALLAVPDQWNRRVGVAQAVVVGSALLGEKQVCVSTLFLRLLPRSRARTHSNRIDARLALLVALEQWIVRGEGAR